MIKGVVSQTALKVATIMLTLNVDRQWRTRLPDGLADLTRDLLLAAEVPPYSPLVIRLNETRSVLAASRLAERIVPGVFTGIGERKLFMNDHATQALDQGTAQVLVIGAGFDTLCLRLAPQYPAARFFEIDHPATSAAKARGLNKIGKPENLEQIAADLGDRPIKDVLADHETFDTSAPTFIVAEGLLMYLTPEDVCSLFDAVAQSTGEGSQFAFSYPLAVERYALSNAALRLMGEPWLSSTTRAGLPDFIGHRWSLEEAVEPLGQAAIEGFSLARRVR